MVKWDGLVPVSETEFTMYPPQHNVRIEPEAIRYLDHELRCWVRTVVGLRATCTCGATSGRVQSWRAATNWKNDHKEHAPDFARLTIAGPLGDRPETA